MKPELPIAELVYFSQIKNLSDIIVVHDDLDSALGKVKIKEGGSAEYSFRIIY